MDRYVCIHGHFYQPPRENPWLEAIELQDSAYPYHDWDERITAECYARNAMSRILDSQGFIAQVVNNYANISFDFGPTVLSWLEHNSPDTYQGILEADRESKKRFSGHGSAVAQAYNHMIMPLANRRDKRTQVIWGLEDFRHRFGRNSEGLWLPETAVDLETLDIAAEQGIEFVILAQRQAHQVRAMGNNQWEDVSGGRIDPTMPYQLSLPSGRVISVFFYDGAIAQAVAFEGLLNSGDSFAERLVAAFSPEISRKQLVHIATDGESYGHHHSGGEMALAYSLHYVEANDLARLTNYAEYLEICPPTHEVEIFKNSSWSCIHGVERWRSDCGCNTGGHQGWNQAWRSSLRNSLDWLRDESKDVFERVARRLLNDPWTARDDYISVLLDRSPESVESFLRTHAARTLNEDDKRIVLKLMELQRHAMLMYTSCGWFFDELSGIETVQVLQYAGRVLQLAAQLAARDMEAAFLERIELAKSNIPEHRDGRKIYGKFVKPAMLDLEKVGAHYAISCLFEDYGEQSTLYSYSAAREDFRILRVGTKKLVAGRVEIASRITHISEKLFFGALHLGDHNISCGVAPYMSEERYRGLVEEITESFARADFPQTIILLGQYFGSSTYSLNSLFRDEKRKVLDLIMEPPLGEAQAAYSLLYEHQAPLIRFLASSSSPVPKSLATAAEVVLNGRLREAFEQESLDPTFIEPLLEEANLADVTLDAASLEHALRRNIEKTTDEFLDSPSELSLLVRLLTAATLVRSLPFEINLWHAQNVCHKLLFTSYLDFQKWANRGDPTAQEWVRHFTILADHLRLRIPSLGDAATP
jgi:alpha-amylase/alpha-mannosidase (GH57 family)